MDVKILDNLKVNQNVLCWVLSYVGIAYAAPHPELACAASFSCCVRSPLSVR